MEKLRNTIFYFMLGTEFLKKEFLLIKSTPIRLTVLSLDAANYSVVFYFIVCFTKIKR
jgi:hypothetical protein